MVADRGEPVTLFFEQYFEFVLPKGALQDQAAKHRFITEVKRQIIFRGSANTLALQYFIFRFKLLKPKRPFDSGLFAQKLFLTT